MRVFLVGASGGMGRTFLNMQDEIDIVAGFASKNDEINGVKIYNDFSKAEEDFDLIIDFSNKDLVDQTIEFALKNNKPLVEATTGLDDKTLKNLEEAAKKIPIAYARNYSIGINMMTEIVERVSKVLSDFDIEIVEAHHRKKKDAPSGTAMMLLDSVKKERNVNEIYDRSNLHRQRTDDEVGISAIRGGSIVGDHTVIFAGDDEVLEIKHKAASKKIFAKGAIKAAEFLLNQESGLYDFKDILRTGEDR
jgi:4-hydroxy-tetrahydrodipicolinate reductase